MRVNSKGQKNVQEEMKEFDESNLLIMNRLTEVVNQRKEKEAKLAEQNAISQRQKASAKAASRSQVSRSIHNSDYRIGTANNSIEESLKTRDESVDD